MFRRTSRPNSPPHLERSESPTPLHIFLLFMEQRGLKTLWSRTRSSPEVKPLGVADGPQGMGRSHPSCPVGSQQVLLPVALKRRSSPGLHRT